MEAQFRPYAIAATLSYTDPSSIVLRDTAGDPLKCNFISVEASGENPDAFYRVGIQTGSQTTPLSDYVDTSASIGATSGVIGGYSTVNKGVVEFLLADIDRSSVIKLELDEDGDCNFFITYGQVQAGNRLRDNERPTGN